MIIDGYVHQLPDQDPEETQEWLDSLDGVISSQGKMRAQLLMAKLITRARQQNVGVPASVSTPYINTIPPEEEAWFPGDMYLEKRIRRFIRWNVAVMVIKANKAADGIGGHLSTFASSAALYEVGFNHFFRGKDDGLPGDHVYIQGHAAPGIYARAYLEHRIGDEDLDRFRREIGGGLSSYPHPVSCRTSGNTRPSRWASVPSTRSTRPGTTSTSSTVASTMPRNPASGLSSVTARPTNRRLSAPSTWPPARSSTI